MDPEFSFNYFKIMPSSRCICKHIDERRVLDSRGK